VSAQHGPESPGLRELLSRISGRRVAVFMAGWLAFCVVFDAAYGTRLWLVPPIEGAAFAYAEWMWPTFHIGRAIGEARRAMREVHALQRAQADRQALADYRADIDAAELAVIRDLRENGRTWTEIAEYGQWPDADEGV
jgi:hypothetical protein